MTVTASAARAAASAAEPALARRPRLPPSAPSTTPACAGPAHRGRVNGTLPTGRVVREAGGQPTEFETAISRTPAARMEQTLGRGPYTHGPEAMKGERDRRTATVRNAFVIHYVAQAALTVTAVRLVPPP
ncbi:hypothetical protein [Streptomyces uncialis]|uniref:hypothetical protein n=1 Tax=Streptomyces uncialis TaxID=1048205 RepID=UPI00386B61BB|nr:hypothetical protein OG268_36375 [Streptomyces uncialis]